MQTALFAVAAIGLLVPMAGTSPGATGGETFRIALPAQGFGSIDPFLNRSLTLDLVLQAACASLLTFPAKPPPAGYRLIPDLAAAQPRISNGGKTYTFTIRRGRRFGTGAGAPVTPRDVAQTFNRVLDARLDSPLAAGLADVAGADAVHAGKARRASGIVVRGRKLILRLTRPHAEFLETAGTLCILPARLPVDPEGVGAPLPTAGPYTITSYAPGRRIVLRRNRYYAGPLPRRLDRIEVTLTDSGSIVDQIKRGAVDWGWVPNSVIAARARELAAQYGVNRGRFFIKRGLFLRLLVLNTSRPLFRGNARLRRAVNFAIDRRALLAERGFRAGNLTDQYLSPSFPGFRNASLYPLQRPDIRRARALARGRTRGRKVVFYGPASPIGAASGQIVQRSLASIGLTVKVELFPASLLFEKLATPGEPFDIGWIGWLGRPDPSLLNFLFDGREIGKPDFGNYSYLDSRKYNRLLERASRLTGSARYRTYGSLDIALAREVAPAVAYAYDNTMTLVGPRTGCVVLKPELDLAAACLKR